MVKEIAVPIVAILAITIILSLALVLGRNGVTLALGVGGICGLGGYEIKSLLGHFKK